jgi:raffinose/stachyose/melibiose transport system substrate-binding protein
MKRRDFLASMGAAGVALSAPSFLSACGGSTGSGGSNNVTFSWWHIQTQDPGKSYLQNVANQYMKQHPNVTIKLNVIENASFKDKLTTVMQSGSPPDLFHSWGGGVLYQYAKAGLVKDLTPTLQSAWGNSFNQSALSVYAQNGHTYGVPFDMGAVGFFYNKALFARAGITQTTQLPATWPDFLALVQKLKNAGITPIAVGEKEQWPGHYYSRVGSRPPRCCSRSLT